MKGLKIKTVIALAIAMVMFAGYSFAQGQGRGIRCPQRFATLDTNNDGKVTLTEFMAVSHPRGDDQARAMFTAKDTDKDGVLTSTEFCPGI